MTTPTKPRRLSDEELRGGEYSDHGRCSSCFRSRPWHDVDCPLSAILAEAIARGEEIAGLKEELEQWDVTAPTVLNRLTKAERKLERLQRIADAAKFQNCDETRFSDYGCGKCAACLARAMEDE